MRSHMGFDNLVAANQTRPPTQLVISDFYNTVVDYVDLIRDFMKWQEERSGYVDKMILRTCLRW